MASRAASSAPPGAPARGIADPVVAGGTATHRYVTGPALRAGRQGPRNLADAAHFLCLVHGFHPGLIDLAAEHAADDDSRAWLIRAGDAFAGERAMLTRIVVAAGPLPSTPGHNHSEAAALGQRHALEMLGRSERAGCAAGAAAALLLDWRAVRAVLDRAAERFGLAPQRCTLPTPAAVLAMLNAAATAPGPLRAAHFGAQQVVLQQQGLWSLLEARAAARPDD